MKPAVTGRYYAVMNVGFANFILKATAFHILIKTFVAFDYYGFFRHLLRFLLFSWCFFDCHFIPSLNWYSISVTRNQISLVAYFLMLRGKWFRASNSMLDFIGHVGKVSFQTVTCSAYSWSLLASAILPPISVLGLTIIQLSELLLIPTF